MKKTSSFLSLLVIVSLLIGALSLAFPAAAQAKTEANPADTALTQAFNTENKWLAQQQQAIAKAEQAGAKIQQLIDTAAAEGLDVSVLQNALAAFNAEMATVKAENESAANLLAAHNGFDEQGNVTDRQAARQTVLDAKQALWQAHVTLSQAARSLHQAVREWKQAAFPQG
jgi:hypothetical protein